MECLLMDPVNVLPVVLCIICTILQYTCWCAVNRTDLASGLFMLRFFLEMCHFTT